MPGYIIHLAEAKKILTQLEELPTFGEAKKERWRQEFLLGALLPDACADKRHTHFWAPNTWENRIVVPDLAAFSEKYAIQKDEAWMMGYWAHLHLDLHFFRDYWDELLEFCDGEGKPAILRADAVQVWLKRQKKFIRTEDFFSEKYCYGDYTKMNVWFCEKYDLQVPMYLPQQGRIPEEAHYEKLPWLLEKLNGYLRQSEREQNEETKIFDAQELDDFLETVSHQFLALCAADQMRQTGDRSAQDSP